MTTETTDATNGVSGKVDLNDPSVRMTRADAMKQMTESRREFLATELDPAQAAMLGQSPPAEGAAAATNDDDTDTADAAAAAERARLERAAAAADTPVLDPTKQSAAQTDAPIELTDDDLKHVVVRRVVNGVERMVTGEELLRDAQKTVAADEYIETARTLLKEAKAVRAGATVAPAETTAAAAKPATNDEASAAIDSVVDHLFQGNVDEAKAQLKNVLLGRGGQQADVASIVDAKLKERVIKEGLRQFGVTHKDIIADPISRALADQFLYQELGRRGVKQLEDLPAEDIPTVLTKTGEDVEGWMARVRGTPGTAGGGGTATTLADRLNRKKKGDELPTASARADMSGASTTKSTTDKLNEMRKARGQPVA